MTFVVAYGPTGTQNVWGKARFLDSLRQGREGSTRERTAVCVVGHQRAHGTERRRGGVKSVEL